MEEKEVKKMKSEERERDEGSGGSCLGGGRKGA